MLFWINVDGDRIAIQAVNRKGSPYFRLAPYTLVYPTPRQREVRHTLMQGAHKASGGTYRDVNEEVKASFDDWQYTPKPVNKTEMALREIYGDQVNEVLNYIQAQKRVETKLSTPEYKQKFNAAIEKLIPASVNE